MIELSANNVAFISCKHKLTEVLTGAIRWKRDLGWGRMSNITGCWYRENADSLPVSTSSNLTRSPVPLLPFFSLAEQLLTFWSVYVYSWWKPPCSLKALSYNLSFHQVLSAMVLSRDVSHVGVAFFASFFMILEFYGCYLLINKGIKLKLVL